MERLSNFGEVSMVE